MTTPVEQVISRGRTVRARRRIRRLAGAVAAVAAAAVALTVLLPAGHQPADQLAAWTVARQANGTINVTIRELRDAAGLQSTLRADGVPASVTFGSEPNPACREYPGRWNLSQSGVQVSSGGPYILAIHPSALPRGAGVQIGGKFEMGGGMLEGMRALARESTPVGVARRSPAPTFGMPSERTWAVISLEA